MLDVAITVDEMACVRSTKLSERHARLWQLLLHHDQCCAADACIDGCQTPSISEQSNTGSGQPPKVAAAAYS